MRLIAMAIIALATHEAGIQVKENVERHTYYNTARQYCDEVDKPLLVVGIKRHFWQPPNGDITVDIDPKVLNIPGGVLADEREMPFNDKTFGACYNAHTLEHLYTPDDVELAVNECLRVSDKVVFLAPSPYSIIANMLVPGHNLRLWFDPANNRMKVANKNNRAPVSTGQALVVQDYAPEIIRVGRGFAIVGI